MFRSSVERAKAIHGFKAEPTGSRHNGPHLGQAITTKTPSTLVVQLWPILWSFSPAVLCPISVKSLFGDAIVNEAVVGI
eukprot:g31421.t1